MNKLSIYISIVILVPVFIYSCSNSKVNKSDQEDKEEIVGQKKSVAGPPVIIYKTDEKNFDKVPVTLSGDKLSIVSYPGIKDVYYKGELAYPTKLNNGYLLDNRGIDINSAFINLTYEQYAALESVPPIEELYDMIIDKEPFIEMYHGGSKYNYQDLVKELNEMIDSDKLDTFKKIK